MGQGELAGKHAYPVTCSAADGAEITGLLYTPARLDRPRPGVVVLHGGPSINSARSEEYLSSALARAGYVVLAGTYRKRAPSEFDLDDALGCISRLGAYDFVDPLRISVAGHSRGGFAAMWLAIRRELTQAAVMIGAGADMEDVAERFKSYDFAHYVELYRYGGGTDRSNARRRSGLSPKSSDLAGCPVPMLWIVGSRDFNSPPGKSKAAYDAVATSGSPDSTLEVIDGMDHFLSHASGPMHATVAAKVVSFLDGLSTTEEAR